MATPCVVTSTNKGLRMKDRTKERLWGWGLFLSSLASIYSFGVALITFGTLGTYSYPWICLSIFSFISFWFCNNKRFNLSYPRWLAEEKINQEKHQKEIDEIFEQSYDQYLRWIAQAHQIDLKDLCKVFYDTGYEQVRYRRHQ